MNDKSCFSYSGMWSITRQYCDICSVSSATIIMSPPIYNGGDILVYPELSVCPSVCPSRFSFPLSNSNIFDKIFTKLYENVCWYKMEAMFDNQLNPQAIS